MIRRDFFKTPLALAGLTLRQPAEAAAAGEELAKAPDLTRSVAAFIVNTKYEDIPEDVVALGKKTLLDGFGLALAGSASVVAPVVRQYISTLGLARKSATVVGTSLKVPARFAAFANGMSIHADDYDDTGSALHVAAPILPPAFALCEEGRRSGRDLMLAFHVGVEAASKIGDAIFPRHDREGFHTTGTIGSFGSAAACAKLRGLNAEQTAYALGIAASQAGGIRRNFGSMTKAFHAGHAAENGSVAADLASLGFTAAGDVLETPLGFFQAAGGGFDPSAIVNRLGRPWMFASPGDLIKRFPCGTIQQPVMDATLRLIAQHAINAVDVDRVEVGGNQSNVNTLFRHRPTTGLEAKFSMEFAVAILLVDGKAGLGQFTDSSVGRAEVHSPRLHLGDSASRTDRLVIDLGAGAAGIIRRPRRKDGINESRARAGDRRTARRRIAGSLVIAALSATGRYKKSRGGCGNGHRFHALSPSHLRRIYALAWTGV